jgi:hypothetical protein
MVHPERSVRRRRRAVAAPPALRRAACLFTMIESGLYNGIFYTLIIEQRGDVFMESDAYQYRWCW